MKNITGRKRIIFPKYYHSIAGNRIIFLAGPTFGSGRWRWEAAKIIQELDKTITVVSPQYIDEYEYKKSDYQFKRQRAWERFYMDSASRHGCILFWLPQQKDFAEGAVYGATTRFELGEWMTRYNADRNISLVIGAEDEFPTIHTIKYDMQMLMSCEMKDSLLETCLLAVNTARTCAPAPEVAPAEIIDLFRVEPPEIEEPEELSLWEELESPSEEDQTVYDENLSLLEKLITDMHKNETWYMLEGSYKGHVDMFTPLKFKRVENPKKLCLGRSDYYDNFIEEIEHKLGGRWFQSDYMAWPDEADSYKSLQYFVDTAERIEFSLEGISLNDIKKAVGFGRTAESRAEMDTRFMTVWEINSVYFSANLEKTRWHLRGNDFDSRKLLKIFKGRVRIEQIVD